MRNTKKISGYELREKFNFPDLDVSDLNKLYFTHSSIVKKFSSTKTIDPIPFCYSKVQTDKKDFTASYVPDDIYSDALECLELIEGFDNSLRVDSLGSLEINKEWLNQKYTRNLEVIDKALRDMKPLPEKHMLAKGTISLLESVRGNFERTFRLYENEPNLPTIDSADDSFEELFAKMLVDFETKYHGVLEAYAEKVRNQSLTQPEKPIIDWESEKKKGTKESAIDFAWRIYGGYFRQLIMFGGDLRKLDVNLYKDIYNEVKVKGISITEVLPNRTDKVICGYIRLATTPVDNWSKTQYTSRTTKLKAARRNIKALVD